MAILINGAPVAPSFGTITQTDFSGVTAHPEFVVKGKQYYNEKGELETGTLTSYGDAESPDGVDIAKIEKTNTSGLVDTYEITLTNGKTLTFTTEGVDPSELGDVPPSYVPKGFTFSSKHGVAIGGDMPIYDNTPIAASKSGETDEGFVFLGDLKQNTLVENKVYMAVPKSDFGDAQPSDVRAGKIFTSANGVKMSGTNTGEDIVANISTGSVSVSLLDVTGGYVEAWYTNVTTDGAIVQGQYTVSEGQQLSLPNLITGSILVLKFPNYVQLYDDTTNVIAYEWSGENGGTVTYCFKVVATQGNNQMIKFWS